MFNFETIFIITTMKFTLLLSLLLSSFFLLGQDYQNVFSFGENGKSYLDFDNFSEGSSTGLRDSIGNYYIGGQSAKSGQDFFSICKLLPNGKKDSTFGINGLFSLVIPINSLITQPEMYEMAFQPDGKIVFVGNIYKTSTLRDAVVCRVTSNGHIDSSFNSIGYFVQNNSTHDFFTTVAVQSDGKILIGGSAYNHFIYRFNEDGSFDTNFGNSGKYILNFSGSARKIKLSETDEIFVGGGRNSSNQSDILIFKLNSDGTLDLGFGNNGFFDPLIYPIPPHFFIDFEINPSIGFVVLGGVRISIQPQEYEVIVFKVSYNGQLDTLFLPSGYLTISHPLYPLMGSDIFLRDDGSLLFSGYFFSGDDNVPEPLDTPFFSEISSDLILNTSLGQNGIVAYELPQLIHVKSQFTSIFEEIDSSIVFLGYMVEDDDADFFALKRKKCFKTYSNIDTIGFTTLTINNETFSQSGVYTQIIANNSDCDSIITINLTLTLPILGVDEVVACDSFTWIDNITYYSSNDSSTFLLTDLQGNDSLVVLNLTITTPSFGVDEIFACSFDSIIWIDGMTYTMDNQSSTFILVNSFGCDSIVTLNLFFNHYSVDSIVTCENFTWIDGVTYTESDNTSMFILPNAAGCDSIITLNLTILQPSFGIDTIYSCEPFTWIDGITYTESNNTAIFILPNAAGCDSIITLNLTILQPSSGIDTISSCEPFIWIDGITYIESNNTATFILPNEVGCDSTITLNLTMGESSTGVDEITSCESLTWIDGITYNESNNTAIFTIPNAAGCDSTITLNLTINEPSAGTDEQISCEPYTWIDGITYTTSNNTATFVLPNAAGCDSIITLDLTILAPQALSTTVYVHPSDPNVCIGNGAIVISGNGPFELEIDDDENYIPSTGNFNVLDLCAGVHSVKIWDQCGDSLIYPFVVPVETNFSFQNAFPSILPVDSIGVTVINCEIDYTSIDSVYIDTLWTMGDTVRVIWDIVDVNGSHYDTIKYVLNSGNGIYLLQYSFYCPNRGLGDYFTAGQAIYFGDGLVSTASLKELENRWVHIYPNPTTNSVHIQLNEPNAFVSVFDVQGKLILTQKVQSQGMISLSDLESGVYLFEIQSEKNRAIKRVIKQ